MRTTIRMDPHLLAEAKRAAADSGRTLTAVIEDAVRAHLAQRRKTGRRPPRPALTIVDGRGVRPGVDLDDTAALLDLMDGRRGPA
ncbi:MAG: CopG family transcriptional regulator [Vicinamibacterales bacterium]